MTEHYRERRTFSEFLRLMQSGEIHNDITWRAYDFENYSRVKLTEYALQVLWPQRRNTLYNYSYTKDTVRYLVQEVRRDFSALYRGMETELDTRKLLDQWVTWSDVCMGLRRSVAKRT